jgi:hypothetical protein
VVLTQSEQEMYHRAHAASAALFQQYLALGPATINKHLLQIMALLLPMRRVCSGERGGWGSHMCAAMQAGIRLPNCAVSCSMLLRASSPPSGATLPDLWDTSLPAALSDSMHDFAAVVAICRRQPEAA